MKFFHASVLGICGFFLLLAAAFFMPSKADALTTLSFGGRVIAVVPCVSALGPSLFVTIKPTSVMAPTYIWTPATRTGLSGPPRTPGQQVIGRFDIPFVCFTPTVPPVPLYGLRMGSLINNVGTSLY